MNDDYVPEDPSDEQQSWESANNTRGKSKELKEPIINASSRNIKATPSAYTNIGSALNTGSIHSAPSGTLQASTGAPMGPTIFTYSQDTFFYKMPAGEKVARKHIKNLCESREARERKQRHH